MTPMPADFFIKACKDNIDCGMRVIEALVEGATKVRELQLEAATEVHASTVATQKAIAASSDPAEMWKQYSQWMLANAQKSATYWQSIAQAMTETNASVFKCLTQVAQQVQAMPGGESDTWKVALAGMIDNAYKQWIDATREFYGASAMLPFMPQSPAAKSAAKPGSARPAA
jgi:hypothetical protein